MRGYIFFIILVLFISSAYASAVNISSVSSIGGSGLISVPRNVVQVLSITFLSQGTPTQSGTFNGLSLTLTSTIPGTYTIYVTIYVNGAFVTSQTIPNVSLSATPVSINTNSFSSQILDNLPVEVDVVATG